MTRQDVSFESGGANLAAWLYLPDGPGPSSVVLMSHGFSATRRMTTDKYAERLCDEGFGVLLYDHRGFGESGGEPRLVVDPWVQAREYRDALGWVRTRADLDPSRLALWGDSYSAGVALVVASIDARVTAVVGQVPALGRELPPADGDGRIFEATRDRVLRPVESPAPAASAFMPVVSDDQRRRPSALTPLTAYRWFIEYGGRFESGWLNDVARATPADAPPWHPALCASRIRCPTLFLVSPRDEMPAARPDVARHAFERLGGPKEWAEIEGGHFGLLYWPSDAFEVAVSRQSRFLSTHLARRRS